LLDLAGAAGFAAGLVWALAAVIVIPHANAMAMAKANGKIRGGQIADSR